MSSVILIPARYNSSRFPGKPISILGEDPVFYHVYKNCIKSSADAVFLVTDSELIKQKADKYDVPCVIVDQPCRCGTDRIAIAAKQLSFDHYINVQGDEPFVDPKDIDKLLKELKPYSKQEMFVVNSYSKHKDWKSIININVGKTIIDSHGYAIAFSRNIIPYPKDPRYEFEYLKVTGLYGFTKSALDFFERTPVGEIEKCEDIEMYRFIENGIKIFMVEGKGTEVAIDTPYDLDYANKIIKEKKCK